MSGGIGEFLLLCLAGLAFGDSEEIRALRAENNRAIADRDLTGLQAVWFPDIQVTASSGTHLNGAQAYLDAFQTLFKQIPGINFVREPGTIQISKDGRTASEYGRWTGIYPNQEVAQTTGTYMAVWRKDERQRWRIAAELFAALASKKNP